MYLLELKNITKRFPGVTALDNFSLSLLPGEIHGLIGENGAGKSTLIKIITGAYDKDSGEVYVNGEKCDFNKPFDSKKKGISCVYQELSIVKQVSVADNIFMGKENNGIFLDYTKIYEESKKVLEMLGHSEIDVRTEAGLLSVGQQQIVEVARAISGNAKLIIMDESTSYLGKKETADLFNNIFKLKRLGITVLFVSHKIDELFMICDRITVMRDGRHILTDKTSNLAEDKLINAMVGREIKNLYPKESGNKGDVWLEVKNLNEKNVLKNVSFKARAGEITSFAGLVGSGRTETMRALFGADKLDSGEIYIKGKKVDIKSPNDAIKNKIAFLSEDRKNQGLILGESVKNNLILASMTDFLKNGFLSDNKINKKTKDNVDNLQIKTPSLDEVTDKLSGGNQQKVVVGKWINTDADIFIFDEPTRGVDVGAKVEIYKIMNRLIKEGKCVIMISSELPEVLSMSDHVYVMREGEIKASIDRDSKYFNQKDIMRAAFGEKIE